MRLWDRRYGHRAVVGGGAALYKEFNPVRVMGEIIMYTHHVCYVSLVSTHLCTLMPCAFTFLSHAVSDSPT